MDERAAGRPAPRAAGRRPRAPGAIGSGTGPAVPGCSPAPPVPVQPDQRQLRVRRKQRLRVAAQTQGGIDQHRRADRRARERAARAPGPATPGRDGPPGDGRAAPWTFGWCIHRHVSSLVRVGLIVSREGLRSGPVRAVGSGPHPPSVRPAWRRGSASGGTVATGGGRSGRRDVSGPSEQSGETPPRRRRRTARCRPGSSARPPRPRPRRGCSRRSRRSPCGARRSRAVRAAR